MLELLYNSLFSTATWPVLLREMLQPEKIIEVHWRLDKVKYSIINPVETCGVWLYSQSLFLLEANRIFLSILPLWQRSCSIKDISSRIVRRYLHLHPAMHCSTEYGRYQDQSQALTLQLSSDHTLQRSSLCVIWVESDLPFKLLLWHFKRTLFYSI